MRGRYRDRQKRHPFEPGVFDEVDGLYYCAVCGRREQNEIHETPPPE